MSAAYSLNSPDRLAMPPRLAISLPARPEQPLRNHDVRPHRAIHELRDVDVSGGAQQLVGVLSRQMVRVTEQRDRLTGGDLRRHREVRVRAHRDPVSARLTSWPI